LDPKGKRPARDLSDLKARLGINKGGQTGAQPSVPGPPGTSQAQPAVRPQSAPGMPPGATGPAMPVVPPMTSPAHPAAPAVEPKRDPYASARAQVAAAATPIVDAGPLLDIPEQRKSKLPLIGAIIAVLVIGLAAGHVFGRISHARVLYNKTLDDADKIKGHVQKLAQFETRVVDVLKESGKRNQGKLTYDAKLVGDLSALNDAPEASPEGRKRLENALFRTNYAMMEDLLINRLFSYYNNSLRLMNAIRAFVTHAEQQKNEIQTYQESDSNAERNFGLVISEAKGNFFLGNLVELGPWVCPDKQATEQGKCKGQDVTGFKVRPPAASAGPSVPCARKAAAPSASSYRLRPTSHGSLSLPSAVATSTSGSTCSATATSSASPPCWPRNAKI
jgi:hypothetical protein